MGMQNFSAEFETPEQYIIDITYKIWEERGVGRLHDWYAADCPVYTPHGADSRVEDVFDHTLSTMHLFPNRDILADDVIIGDKSDGFISSHRARSIGRHLGDGYYGPATNRPIVTLAIADCLCQNNQVVAEWLLGDQARNAIQLGLDPVAFGKEKGTQNPEAYTIGNEAMRQRWSDPQGLTIIGDESIANRISDTYTAIWNEKKLNVMDQQYDRAVRFEGPAGHLCYGRARTGNVFSSIIASIPEGHFEPYHIIVRQQPERAVRVAMRWSYCGSHSGVGRYGKPGGTPVAILGNSHFELREGLIANEWMVIDEIAVYAQMAAYQLS
ncbi:MAG: ester cyclase [Candidatus Promineifilaceae bacterium]|nr:ester cyclase [Candidatus Promineifilaceae bacterium]